MYHNPNSGLDLPCHSLLFNNKKEHDKSYLELKWNRNANQKIEYHIDFEKSTTNK